MVVFLIEYVEEISWISHNLVMEIVPSSNSIVKAIHFVLTALSKSQPCPDGIRFVGCSLPFVSQLVCVLASPFVHLSCDNQFIYWKPIQRLPAPWPLEKFLLPSLFVMSSEIQTKLRHAMNDWTVASSTQVYGPIYLTKATYTRELDCDLFSLLSQIMCNTAVVEACITESGIEYILNNEQMQELAINMFL